MIRMHLSSVDIGMCIAKPVYNNDGKLLIDKGNILKKTYISKLENYGIEYIYIEWDKKTNYAEIISKETAREALRDIEKIMKDFNYFENEKFSKIKDIVNHIVTRLLSKKNILLYMTDIRGIDDYTFHHSLYVCVYSLVIGVAFEYSRKQLEDLGIGALLHDIGKVVIPSSILKKPWILTGSEYEEIKKHSIEGYNIVKEIEGISEESCIIVRDHHERFDGTGYPHGLKGKEIHEYARIVAICDVFDALTSNRIYRERITSHYALEYLIALGNHQFDYDIIKIFLKHITIYPIGTNVQLESGERGVVIERNDDLPTRPIVRVNNSFIHQINKPNKIIDLKKHLNNGIKKVL
ncbi:HD-GYP domain-containing protein [Alkaliphilus peptidifermentans]|uniref:HD-GYP domain, c-di-GMP phosphodiesterase class II (Or its inactivated variant) n=1 Tax=Alkaliphilus peptidifermentans DSM 18978 TaxID=1120976 RepID=A0A1G5KXD4_9FIRM|nr:HD-GYP domain-containing protein [Alkaliphilus peptidifermentans]SCZ05265.1 HD-GYP domain, c-di-GMP phosphodiesterase class II (or its inactivated variant) [Alkaliphilus peptidifermentans DSM 18978]